LGNLDPGLQNSVVEVALRRDDSTSQGVDWHGFRVLPAQEELGAKAGVTGGPQGMVVSQVLSDGALAKWNALHSGKEVSVGDWILQVNDERSPLQITRKLLEERELRMTVVRFPPHSVAMVSKGGKELGLTFRQPRSAKVHELLIMEVAASGAVARHNSAQAASGHWDLLVLPKMCITGVNGIEGDLERMMDSIRNCETAELRVRRSGPIQVRAEKHARAAFGNTACVLVGS